MVELGAAVGSHWRGTLDRFSALIRPISEHVVQSRRTSRDASERGEALAEAMARFAAWTGPYMKEGAMFIARPAAFDRPWIVRYAWARRGRSGLGRRAANGPS